MVTISVRYDGTLRCTARHGPSDANLTTDAPRDNHGRGESFSPTDLVATALATCAMTIMGIVADREGLDLGDMTAEVQKAMVADPKRRIDALPVTIRVPAALAAEQRTMLEEAARTCPVAMSLDPRIRKAMTFAWGAAAG